MPKNRKQLLAKEMTRDSQQCLNEYYIYSTSFAAKASVSYFQN